MSTEIGSGVSLPTGDGGDLLRLEGIETETRTFPEGARHGGAGMFVLQDDHRPAAEIDWDAGEYRQIPDGSLYQTARAAQYAAETVEDNQDRERTVLSRSYQVDGETFAVTMTDSRSQFGIGTGDDRTTWYKYDLTLQPLQNGEIQWHRTPAKSLNVKLIPQNENLVYKDGEPQNPPFGPGTKVEVQCTWVDDPEKLLERASRLVQDTLGYDLRELDVHQQSKRFWKAEVHHRVQEALADRLAYVIRQSGDLLARHETELESHDSRESDRWLEAKLTTEGWHKLGFPITGHPILIKMYYPDNPERLEYPMDQPKVEVALAGSGRSGQQLHWDRWAEIHQVLEEILYSHLQWAGVDRDDLVADDFSAGPAAPEAKYQHPAGRREWLQDHYQSLLPDLYREANKPQTAAVYDILQVVSRRGTVTYQELQEETGLAYRTVREHVTRLCAVGGEEPGILSKVQDAQTWVAFSSRFLEGPAEEALDQVHPDDQLDDLDDRAQQRRERRDRDDQEAGDGDQEGDRESTTWRYFADVDLTPQQLRKALENDYLPADHVRVRTDDSPLFAPG